MRSRLMSITLSIVTLVVILPQCTFSQTKDSNTKNSKRWLMSIYAAKTSNHVVKEFENAMIVQGYNVTTHNFLFGGTIEHPWTDSYNLAWMAGIHYMFKPRFSLGLVVGNSMFGETFGARSEFQNIFIKYSSITVSPLFSANIADRIRFGIGPSLFFAKATKTSDLPESSKTNLKLGVVLDAGLTLFEISHVFGEFKLQYRRIGKVKVGPYQEDSGTFLSEINYDHWLIGFGLAIKLE